MKLLARTGYFKTREAEIKVYEILGVIRFKRLMIRSVGEENARKMGWYPIKNSSGQLKKNLLQYARKTKLNELAHLAVLVALLVASVNLFTSGQFGQGIVVIAINIPFNVYPIMLQRYNRRRINYYLQARNLSK